MKYLPIEAIKQKRDQKILSQEILHDWIQGVAHNEVSDAQIAAFAMATYLNGMNDEEIAHLTAAMTHSGDILNWTKYGLDKQSPIVDKHSTGGVGDKTSFLIAPILAACGCYNPMISGRGLGHTGGTLDKLESIPNFRVDYETDEFMKQVKDHGLAIVSASQNIAPADKRIYAIRDVTSTVDALPLITGSILSKKLASNLNGLVLDVKTGYGAFMEKWEDSVALAEMLTKVAKNTGLSCGALITDMNATLGHHVGNSLEILEIINWFNGHHLDERLTEISIELSAYALTLVNMAKDQDEGRQKAWEVVHNGKAAEAFEKMVSLQSGHHDILSKYEKLLPKAPVMMDIFPEKEGTIIMQDSQQIGMAMIKLGGARSIPNEKIDHSVGFENIAPNGTYVDVQTPLMRVHAKTEDDVKRILPMVLNAFTISKEKEYTSSQAVLKMI